MAIEIANAIHAMALVSTNDRGDPIFVGQGNVGFAPFGSGPDFSEKVGTGQYRLHMLSPISILSPNHVVGRGEGLVFAQTVGDDPNARFALPNSGVRVSTSGLSDILIETLFSPTTERTGAVNFAEVLEDKATTSNVFTDLLTVPITTAAGGSGSLFIEASASAEASALATEVQFRVTLDGSPVGPGAANGASFSVAGAFTKAAIAIIKVVAVTPGAHTVTLQWRVIGVESSASILVATGNEHGSLLVKEDPIIAGFGDSAFTFEVLVLRMPQQSTG